MLAVIGGSGLYHLPGIEGVEAIELETPYGPTSGAITRGKIDGHPICFLPRHGTGHRLNPGEVPYRANIHALKQLGVSHLLSVSAVGSLREELPPGTMVLPDQIIDRTAGRDRTFFEVGLSPMFPWPTHFVMPSSGRYATPPGPPTLRRCRAAPMFASKGRSSRPAPNRAFTANGAPRSLE